MILNASMVVNYSSLDLFNATHVHCWNKVHSTIVWEKFAIKIFIFIGHVTKQELNAQNTFTIE